MLELKVAKHKLFSHLFTSLLLTCASLYSMDLTEALRIDGFGAVGVSTNERQDIQFKPYDNQTSGVGRNRYDIASNTVVGAQGRYQINDSLSLGAQGVISYEGDGAWKKELEWAYANYDAENGVSLKMGKFRFPLFQSSELSYVGYSRIYAQPQLFFYGVGGYLHLIGAQANYNSSLGEYDVNLRATYGLAHENMPIKKDGSYDSVKSDDIKIISAKIGDQRFWVNLFYTKFISDVTTHNGAAPGHKGKTNLNMTGAEFEFRYAGAILNGGYGKANVERFLPDETNIYASFSYPIENFTPYILYRSKIFSHIPPIPTPSSVVKPKPPTSGLPQQNSAPPAQNNENIDRAISLGCRYDVMPGLALKVQWDRMDAGVNSKATINTSGKQGIDNALSVVADWMF